MQPVLWAMGGTGFAFFMTVLGSAVVFLFKDNLKESYQRIFLGFAAGVMIAASVWSLLIPAIEEAQSQGIPGWFPAAGGFCWEQVFCLLWIPYFPIFIPEQMNRKV